MAQMRMHGDRAGPSEHLGSCANIIAAAASRLSFLGCHPLCLSSKVLPPLVRWLML